MKICTMCNHEKVLTDFIRDKHAKGGYRNQCKKCSMVRVKKSYEKCKDGVNSRMRAFRSTWKGCTGTSLEAAKGRSKKSNLPFNITLEDLRILLESQDYKCALSGDNLVIKGGWSAPSLDKINPKLGYVVGNIQWLTQRMNLVKGNLTNEEFLIQCAKCLERSETIRKEYAPSGVEAPSPQE